MGKKLFSNLPPFDINSHWIAHQFWNYWWLVIIIIIITCIVIFKSRNYDETNDLTLGEIIGALFISILVTELFFSLSFASVDTSPEYYLNQDDIQANIATIYGVNDEFHATQKKTELFVSEGTKGTKSFIIKAPLKSNSSTIAVVNNSGIHPQNKLGYQYKKLLALYVSYHKLHPNAKLVFYVKHYQIKLAQKVNGYREIIPHQN